MPAVVAALAMLAGVLAFAPQASAHSNEGYRNESTAAEDNSDWMASLPAYMPLSQLSIPGTHDTAAYNFGRESTETQGMDVTEQLKAGIRAWDMRLGVNDAVICPGPELWTFHGISCQFEKFSEDILPVAQDFLTNHPGETILMRVKHENGDIDDFASTVEAEMDAFPGLFYEGGNSNPTLGDMRGKIVLLRNYSGSSRGISWDDFDIQDEYSVGDNWDLADKWGHVKDKFNASDRTSTMDTKYINFLSAAGGSFPYFIASGHSSWETDAPRLATGWTDGFIDTCSAASQCIDEYPRLNCFLGTCTVFFEGVNTLAMNYIRDSVEHRVGIVMADFPGPGLIDAIIDLNPWNLPPIADAGGPYTTTENSVITFDAGGSRDPDGDSLQYRWDFDGDGNYDTTRSSATTAQYTFGDDFVGAATVEVYDGFATSTDTATVTVTNVAPAITASATNVDENGTSTLSGTITDPSPHDTFTLTVDWGEGAPEVADLPAGTTSYSLTHQYLDDNPSGTPADIYPILLGIVDDDGGIGSATAAVEVTNVAPVVSLDSVTDEVGAEVGEGTRLVLTNTKVDLAAGFTDLGSQDTHVASVDWGDGTLDDLGATAGTTGSSHVYATAGTYVVTITVVDDDTGVHSQSRTLAVVDAADALWETATALQAMADDPSIPGRVHIQKAVDWLIGNNGGAAANGAVDQLDKGNLNSALDKIAKALAALEAAEAAGSPDLSDHRSSLVLAAKSVAVGATDAADVAATKGNDIAKVAQARSHIETGSTQMLNGDFLPAVDSFQSAVRAIAGVRS